MTPLIALASCLTLAAGPITMEWEPASGPVDHYVVLDGSGLTVATSPIPEATFDCPWQSDGFAVRVAAVGADGSLGPAGEASIPMLCMPGRGTDFDSSGDTNTIDFLTYFLPVYVQGCGAP